MALVTNAVDMAATGAQDGIWRHTIGTWEDPSGFFAQLAVGSPPNNPLINTGLRFPAQQDGGAPTRPVRATAGTLTIQLANAVVGQVTVTARLIGDPLAPAWSNAFLPDGNQAQYPGDSLGILGSVVIPAGSMSGVDFPITVLPSVLSTVCANSNWTGLFNIYLTGETTPDDPTGVLIEEFSGFDEGNAPRLSWTHETFLFTGLSTPRWASANSRADLCPRCGQPSLREDWLEDGIIDGLLVCVECWDPPEPDRRLLPPEDPRGIND